jgi:hypothetical protein
MCLPVECIHVRGLSVREAEEPSPAGGGPLQPSYRRSASMEIESPDRKRCAPHLYV